MTWLLRGYGFSFGRYWEYGIRIRPFCSWDIGWFHFQSRIRLLPLRPVVGRVESAPSFFLQLFQISLQDPILYFFLFVKAEEMLFSPTGALLWPNNIVRVSDPASPDNPDPQSWQNGANLESAGQQLVFIITLPSSCKPDVTGKYFRSKIYSY